MKANNFIVFALGCKAFNNGNCTFGGFKTKEEANSFGKQKVVNGEIDKFYVLIDSHQPQWFKDDYDDR